MPEHFTDHSHDLVVALGHLTMEFADLEERLRESIWTILGGNLERAQIMTAGITFQVLTEKWSALFAQKFAHLMLPEPLAKLRTSLLSINERRNRLIHSVWGLDIGTGISVAERLRAKPGVGIDWQISDVPPKELQELRDDISAAGTELDALVRSGDDAFKVLGPKRRR